MKTMIVCLTSCASDKETEDSGYPLEITSNHLAIDHLHPKAESVISSGNGDYTLTLLKDYHVDEEYKDFPIEELLSIKIEGEKIIAERLLLKEYYLCVNYMLSDAKGYTKIITIENPGMENFPSLDRQ
ncbi:hypothetical protein [Bacteroides sp. 519]|uniref:hypothetical protein n=1 Tax=Bacteroides sp. 519 TaxID=2302937 RepID=UPI0013D1FF0C|nr:hypothetical protein [Bacteroides sp. 519]NDV56890.1 hypothetical protein [Bacteroides sp. 519]